MSAAGHTLERRGTFTGRVRRGKGGMPRLILSVLACLMLCACGKPGVDLVKNGTVPENPAATVGQALSSYEGFSSVTWEQYTDAQGVTRVLATGQYREQLPAIILCPPRDAGGMVRAGSVLLRMEFEVDLKAKTFVFTGATFLVYSPKGFSMEYPAGLSAFDAVLQGMSGLNCGVLYAPR